VLVRRAIDARTPPTDLDAQIAWFDALCENLVLLEEYSPGDLRQAVASLDRAVRAHIERGAPTGGAVRGHHRRSTPDDLEADHEHFLASLDELDSLLHVVERDGHGGNRQALGQYGRLLAEALGRHRREEAGTYRLAPPNRPGRPAGKR